MNNGKHIAYCNQKMVVSLLLNIIKYDRLVIRFTDLDQSSEIIVLESMGGLKHRYLYAKTKTGQKFPPC